MPKGDGSSPHHVVAEFADALQAAGFRLRCDPIMDGEWRRCAVEGDKGSETSGGYRGYLTGIRPAGSFQNFRDATKSGRWKFGATMPALSPAQREAMQREIAAVEAERERSAEARDAAIARQSVAAWDRATSAPADHPYLRRKGVQPHRLRVDSQGVLLVPLRNADGELRSLQRITSSGAKLFPKGGRLHGLQLLLGTLAPGAVLLIAEGFATGATLHEATGHTVAVAFTKSNLVPIACIYAGRFLGLRVVFAGDNDHRHPLRDPPLPNGGWEAAEEAARETGGIAILPEFAPEESGSDWNDYAAQHGKDAVRVALAQRIAEAFPPPLQPHYPAPTSTRDEAPAALDREATAFFHDAKVNVAIRHAWKAKREAVEEAHPPKSPARRVALRIARQEMTEAFGPDWRKPGRRLLLPAAAGSGKSTLAARLIREAGATLGIVFYATDKTANAEDIAEEIPGAAVVRGRSQKDPLAPGETMCRRPGAAEAVARAGQPVGSTLCRNAEGQTCRFHGVCGWQREAARNHSGAVMVFAGSHEYLTHQGPMPAPDAVVIDESPVAAMLGHIEFGFDRLLPDAMPEWRAAGLAQAMAFRECMVKVRDAMRDPAGILAGLRQRGIRTAKDFKPATAYLRAAEESAFTGGITPDMDDGEIVERLGRHERSEIGSVLKLLTALQAEIGLPRDAAHGVAFYPDKPVMVDGRRERQARVAVHYRQRPTFPADVPLLLLDASGDAEVSRRLFGGRLEVAAAIRCERNVEVVQVLGTTFPKSSLLGTDRRGNSLSASSVPKAARLRGEVSAVANALAAKHGLFMLATNMPVEDKLKPELGKGVLTGHFGALRGSNAYEGCTAGLILGREQPPATAMEDIARAIWSDDPEPLCLPGAYVKAERRIRMRDPSAKPVTVTVDVHPDPRVQRVLELHRERESEQAADRLRLVYNPEPKTLYLAGNLPLDITVDRVVTWRQLVHEATGQLDNGHKGTGRRFYGNRLTEAWRLSGGALPLSHRTLARLFPAIWPSERRAREDMDNVPTWLIEILLAKSAHYPVRVRYRLAEQRGRDCMALVLPDEAGRAALAALVGPLAHFAPDLPPDPPSPPAPPATEPDPMPEAISAILEAAPLLPPVLTDAQFTELPEPEPWCPSVFGIKLVGRGLPEPFAPPGGMRIYVRSDIPPELRPVMEMRARHPGPWALLAAAQRARPSRQPLP